MSDIFCKVDLFGTLRTVTQHMSVMVKPETKREEVFALVSGVKRINEIVLTDSSGQVVKITPHNFTKLGGEWKVDGVDGLKKLDRLPRYDDLESPTKIIIREDVNFAVSEVLHAMNSAFPAYGSRESGVGGVSSKTRSIVWGLHTIGYKPEAILEMTTVTKLETVNALIAMGVPPIESDEDETE